jgi:type II secretory pathway component PulC
LFSMRVPFAVVGAFALGLFACGGASPEPSSSPGRAPSTRAATVSSAAAPDHVLSRSAVHAAIAQGLGAFLQHVELDDKPVFVGGRFRGFRIAALRDPAFWKGVDLKPGDVVTRVNGLPIERPEQALRAFESLDASSELRVSYERGGEPHELSYPIVDDR